MMIGDNVREQQWDKGTYEALFQISKDQPDLVEVRLHGR